MNRVRIGSAVLFAVFALGALLWVKFRTPDTWVTLDNVGETPITVVINDKDMGSIPAHSFKRLEKVESGKYKIVAKNSSGSIIEQSEYSVVAQGRGGSNTCYVYNLTGKGHYVLATVYYNANPSSAPGPTEQVLGKDSKFFQVTGGSNCQLDESIPNEITTNSRAGTTSKTYLCHTDDQGNVKCPGY